ncbi:ImmA/IrrE family metallo-endopeptidase [Clostridium tyrobutyricum]|uniref:ImmA/IrrE family metallo-endopeptidase n=1 Tax=Clostridium tyrobutyricum TaxID=1519 RepID=UPI001C3935D6|nr:ImmA/IrrE family metallo-endopeptidase [Clostridium tyrobutyricum]MBV4429403.1 ImmA/IrrE family metallo-endopeptidase [Clostridium tyrobutyricum]MBV4443030.1 ImmA/IrrE family metallo-endopeptidase [Clostridium tyrobutyricum]
MTKEEIINLAHFIKEKFSTRNAIHISKQLGIELRLMHLKPNIYPAYTSHVGRIPIINLNEKYTLKSQMVLCAHELGHALMHGDKLINEFNDNHNGNYEYEANLFAVALLFNQDDLRYEISKMDNYILKGLLDKNIHLK